MIIRPYRPDDFDPVTDLRRRSRLAAFPDVQAAGLSLRTFQMNANGRAFYEKNGFVIARFGVSPPPESEPDVEYRWQP